MITFQNTPYYINGEKPSDEEYKKFFVRKRPTEEVDYFLAQRNHCSFQPKHLADGYESLSWVLGFFRDLIQPSEQTVRRAMIWSLQDGDRDGYDNKYAIKAGGGSMSDSIFSSSLSIGIMHPQTGEDAYVVLMKKYSQKFENVLITYPELKALFDQVATPQEKEARDKEHVRDLVALLMSGYYSEAPMNIGGKRVVVDPSFIQAFAQERIKPNFSKSQITWALEDMETRVRRHLETEVEGGEEVNRKRRQNELKRLQGLKLIRGACLAPTVIQESLFQAA